jgi:hypothetical protein
MSRGIPLDSLRSCCSEQDTASVLRAPFRVMIREDDKIAWWSAASNGHALLAYRGQSRPITIIASEKVQNKVSKWIRGALEARHRMQLYHLGALRSFVGRAAAGQRRGRILGRLCNLNYVARVLSRAPGSSVRIDALGDCEAIRFVGDGWVGLVMPIYDLSILCHEAYPSWPTEAQRVC